MAQARATDRTQPLTGGNQRAVHGRRGTHTGPYGGVAPTGKPVEVRDAAIWHFRNGKVAEIRTLQDQFAILKQIGYLPECVHAA